MIWIFLYLIGIAPTMGFLCKVAAEGDDNSTIIWFSIFWPIMLPFVIACELGTRYKMYDKLNKLLNKWREK